MTSFVMDVFTVVSIRLLGPRPIWCSAKIFPSVGGLPLIACLGEFFRFYVSGLMKGGADLFVENLPGFPDNIRASSSGGYWVGMSTIRSNPGFSMLDFLSERPYLKRMIFKVTVKTIDFKKQNENASNYGFFDLYGSSENSSSAYSIWCF